MQQAQHARGWNFLPKLTFVITIGLITAATGFQASATDVFTDPVGFITLTAQGTTGPGSPAYSFLGLGMTQIPALRGVATAVSGPSVAITGLTASQFNAGPLGPLFYVEDVNSNSTFAGFADDIVSNDANNIYLANNDSSEIAVNDNIKIIPHWTLASVFGATDQSGLQQGSSATADQILIQNPLTQTFTTYYYATASKALTAGWKNVATANADASQTPLYNDQGVLINRQVSTNLSVQLIGAVKIGPTIVPLVTKNNFAGNVYATSAITLSNSALYTDGNQSDSVVAGSSATADLVLIHNDATGLFNTYYYAAASKALTAGWKSVATANADASTNVIPIGAQILIQIQSPRPGFNWKEPAPY